MPGGVPNRAGPPAGWHHFPGARRLAASTAWLGTRPGHRPRAARVQANTAQQAETLGV